MNYFFQILSLSSCTVSLDFLQEFGQKNRLTVLDVSSSDHRPMSPLVNFILVAETLSEVHASDLGALDEDASNLLLSLLYLTKLSALEMGNYDVIQTEVNSDDVRIRYVNLEAFLVIEHFHSLRLERYLSYLHEVDEH